MAYVEQPGTSWFYIKSGPNDTEEVREAFDYAFRNCVSQIVEKEGSFWVFVDMGRQCMLLSLADEKIKANSFIVNGWSVTYGIPDIN
jgi:hypothetical protein